MAGRKGLADIRGVLEYSWRAVGAGGRKRGTRVLMAGRKGLADGLVHFHSAEDLPDQQLRRDPRCVRGARRLKVGRSGTDNRNKGTITGIRAR